MAHPQFAPGKLEADMAKIRLGGAAGHAQRLKESEPAFLKAREDAIMSGGQVPTREQFLKQQDAKRKGKS